ncbi:MAG: ferritin-like domain-containing protein, partial [Gluconacetobacter diazotrophicus]|nr:ferritin-like domain-containing protein [Gluconacetobacter diazotrophicus]
MNLPLPNPELATSLGRRAFLRRSGLAAFTAALGPVLANTLFNPTEAQAASFSDEDILNFALNLEYLEGEYYAKAAFGANLAGLGVDIGGSAAGSTISPTGLGGGGGVGFGSQIIKEYAIEIAEDEIAHINFLRKTLGSAAVPKPAIDLQDAFVTTARMLGISNDFNAYASDANFLIGAITLTDVGVTAYHGSAAFLNDKTNLAAAGGILAAESYHDATLRTSLYGLNYGTDGSLAQQLNLISQLRDSLDGP